MPPKQLQHSTAAGEALDSETLLRWKSITGTEIKEGIEYTVLVFIE